MKTKLLRALALILVLCLCATPLGVFARDTDAPAVDTAAFAPAESGGISARTVGAWTNDALSTSQIRTLLNSQTLHPQRTGWDKLDRRIEELLSAAGGTDAYTKLWYAYQWLVKNVTYYWDGYSYKSASVAAYNSVNGYDHLKDMTFEEGLAPSIPDDMANRAYHMLTVKKGVCYDYAIAFAVIARYVGINAYVHTGLFYLESSGSGHHGWSVLTLSGKSYVFDLQRDARNWEYRSAIGYYFGIPKESAHRYQPDYWAADRTANAARDASMLPVDAYRQENVTLTLKSEGDGTVSGGGVYPKGNTVTITAVPGKDALLEGWYAASGTCLGTGLNLKITLVGNHTVTAKFIPKPRARITCVSSRSGSARGGGEYTVGTEVTLHADFDPLETGFEGWYSVWGNLLSQDQDYTLTVDRDTTVYALYAGDVFADIPEGAWYLASAMDCNARGLIQGTTKVTFAGGATFTRAMAVTVLYRLAGEPEAAEDAPLFTDTPEGSWYTAAVRWAAGEDVIKGWGDGTFHPDDPVTRQEFFTMIARYLGTLEIQGEPDGELPYTDASDVADYALEHVQSLQALGMLRGDDKGMLRPSAPLTRAEGGELVSRLARLLETYDPADPADPV